MGQAVRQKHPKAAGDLSAQRRAQHCSERGEKDGGLGRDEGREEHEMPTAEVAPHSLSSATCPTTENCGSRQQKHK